MAYTSFAASVQCTMSNGNLTAAHANATQGGARSADFQASGKYYFEITLTTITGSQSAVGILQGTAGVSDMVNGTIYTAAVYQGSSGTIWGNGGASGKTLGTLASGDVIGVAVDFTNLKIWFRKAPSGNWNGQAIGSQDPANNVGGVSFSSLPGGAASPAIVFAGTGTGATENFTANFGGASFSGSVPSGFTSGWLSNVIAAAMAGLHPISEGLAA